MIMDEIQYGAFRELVGAHGLSETVRILTLADMPLSALGACQERYWSDLAAAAEAVRPGVTGALVGPSRVPHWHAGWNNAGYLPETPYGCFLDASDAVDYLIEAIERDDEMSVCEEDHGCVEAGFCTTIAALQSARADGDHVHGLSVPHGDWLVYCVVPCVDPGCEHTPGEDECGECDSY